AGTPRGRGDLAQQKAPYAFCIQPADFPSGMVANLEKSFFPLPSGMPRGAWRAPIHNFHAFAVQSFIDEIAVATKQDAVQLRLDLLGPARRMKYEDSDTGFDTGRLAGVLQLAADKIGWKDKRSDGHGLGIACHFTFGGYAAHAFE